MSDPADSSSLMSGGLLKNSTVTEAIQRKTPLMPTVQCDFHLEIDEKNMQVEATEGTSERQQFELQKLRDQHRFNQEMRELKLKAINQVFECEIQCIVNGNAPDMVAKMDKAYEKFQARLDKIGEGSLRCFLSFLSEEKIVYFWQRYEGGEVDDSLCRILVTLDMQSQAEEAGCTIRIRSTIDEKEYETVRGILHHMKASFGIQDRTFVRTTAHDEWERYVLHHVEEVHAKYLIEQSRYHPVVGEYRSDKFFFPSMVSFWYEHYYTLPQTMTEATEYAVERCIYMYCKEYQIQTEDVWEVLQNRLYEIGKQIFEDFAKTQTFSKRHDVPDVQTCLFGLLESENTSATTSSMLQSASLRRFPITSSLSFSSSSTFMSSTTSSLQFSEESVSHEEERSFFVSDHVYFYCMAVYLSKTKNVFLRKTMFQELVKSRPQVLYYVAGILRKQSTFFFIVLTNYIMKTFPVRFEQCAILGNCLIESKCLSIFQGSIQQLIRGDQELDLSITDISEISLKSVEAVIVAFKSVSHFHKINLITKKEITFMSEQFRNQLSCLGENLTSCIDVQVRNTSELAVISRYIIFHKLFFLQADKCERQHSLVSIKIEAVNENFSHVDIEITNAFADALISLPFLETLHIKGFESSFLTDMFEIIIHRKSILKLRQLILSHNNLEYSFADYIFEVLNCLPYLKQLDIGNNKIRGIGCVKLLPLNGYINVCLESNGIEECLKTLSTCEKLALQIKDIFGEQTKLYTLEDIENLQQKMNNVIEIDLSNTSVDIVNTFCQILPCFSRLTNLNLSNCQITEHVASILADSFEHMLSLNYLDLSSNNIGDVGIIYLGSKIVFLKHLTYANFHSTQISVRGVVHLLDVVHEEQKKFINVSDNMEGLCHILPYIKNRLPLYRHELQLDAKELSLASVCFVKDIVNITHCLFDDMQLNYTDFEKFCLGLPNLYCLRKLSMKNNNIDHFSVEVLCSAMATFDRVNRFYLDQDSNDMDDHPFLGKDMELKNCLKQLDLRHNKIGEVGSKNLSKGMENMTWLMCLDIGHNNIGDVGAENLSKGMENMTQLQQLGLCHNNIGDVGADSLSKGISHIPRLRHLHLSHNFIGNVGVLSLSKVFASTPLLSCIDFSHNFIGDVGAKSLGERMVDMTWLKKLHLSHNEIGDVGVCSLGKGMDNKYLLYHIDISYNKIGDVGAVSLGNGIERTDTLRSIDLSHNNIGDVGAESLSKGMKCMLSLTNLNLSHNHIADVGAEKLCNKMYNISFLDHVDLSHNIIRDFGSEGFSMQGNIELKYLDISHNIVGDRGAETLSKGMKKMNSLEHLYLNHNNIGDGGARRLGQGMKGLAYLQHLDLSHNDISDVGAEHLSNGIRNMKRPKIGKLIIDLRYNKLNYMYDILEKEPDIYIEQVANARFDSDTLSERSHSLSVSDNENSQHGISESSHSSAGGEE